MSIAIHGDEAGSSQTTTTQHPAHAGKSDSGICEACGPDAVLRLVIGLCQGAGVPCADARPIPWVSSENEIVLIPSGGVVARVTDLRHLARMRRELQVARFLDEAGIPAVQPAPEPPSPQLTVLGDRVITWWTYVDGERPTLLQVAAALKQLHRVQLPVAQFVHLPRLDPCATMRRRAQGASSLPDADSAAYARYVAALAERWEASSLARAPEALLHGDPHQDNAIVAADGRVLLLDFEDVALGPALYDLRAPIARVRMGNLPEPELAEFFTAYGPVPGGELDLAADLKIAAMCGAYIGLCQKYPHIVEQTRLRIRSLTDPSLYPQWWTKWQAPDA